MKNVTIFVTTALLGNFCEKLGCFKVPPPSGHIVRVQLFWATFEKNWATLMSPIWSHCPCPTFLGNFCEKLGYFKVPHLVTLSVSNCLCNKLECPLLLLLLFPTQNVHLFFRQLSKPISELFSLPTH